MSAVPTFIIMGHPNEGKSSIVATLTENNQIRISPTPGETVTAHEYPVHIDGRCVIRFVDTPGFQNPQRTLQWMLDYSGPESMRLKNFRTAFSNDPDMDHECELFAPLLQNTGIIFVVDGSRPVRRTDKAEMDIVRLTGRPRMAILNCKTDDQQFVEEWKHELRQRFNIVRTLNALTATFTERIRLLENLRALEQDWETALDLVIQAFTQDWQHRNQEAVHIFLTGLRHMLTLTDSAPLLPDTDPDGLEEELTLRLHEQIRAAEQHMNHLINAVFRHEALTFLPPHSILRADLFSVQTWRAFGLNKHQLVAGAVLAGGAAGAALDAATIGQSLGLFALASGAVAGLAAIVRGEQLATRRILGLRMGHRRVQVGPLNSSQWFFILTDRFFLHYWHLIQRTHACRNTDCPSATNGSKIGLSSSWDHAARALGTTYFQAVQRGHVPDDLEAELSTFFIDQLHLLSTRPTGQPTPDQF